jgi:hypothetical protein
MKPKLFGLIVGMCLLGASQAIATTYTYTGHDFTAASGAYTTSDSVTASVTLSQPLGPNFAGVVTPVSFTISDGRDTI